MFGKTSFFSKFSLYCLIVFGLILSFSQKASAVELIVNGGFETAGTLVGWTAVNSPSPWRLWQNTTAGQGGGFLSVATTTVVQGTRNAWQGMTDNVTTNSQWQLYQSVVIPAGQYVNVTWRDRYQINHTQFCPGGACQPKFYFVEITNAAGTTVLQTLHTQSTIGNVNQDTGWVSRSAVIPNTLSGQTVRLRFRGTETTPLSGPGQIEIDAVSMDTFIPTAATAALGGRVVDSSGRGLRGVSVALINPTGGITFAVTNSFGRFSFEDLPTGAFYNIEVSSKKYVFNQPSTGHLLNDDFDQLEFIGGVP